MTSPLQPQISLFPKSNTGPPSVFSFAHSLLQPQMSSAQEFPGGLAVGIQCPHRCSPGLIPGLGTEIPQQAAVSTPPPQKKKSSPLFFPSISNYESFQGELGSQVFPGSLSFTFWSAMLFSSLTKSTQLGAEPKTVLNCFPFVSIGNLLSC